MTKNWLTLFNAQQKYLKSAYKIIVAWWQINGKFINISAIKTLCCTVFSIILVISYFYDKINYILTL